VKSTRALLSEAWSARYGQDLLRAQDIYLELLRSETQGTPFSAETRLEVDLLKVSLLRAHMKAQESAQLLNELDVRILEKGLLAPFEFYFESALQKYFAGNYWDALEFFHRAQGSYPPQSERGLLCAINILLCKENLGLETENERAQLGRARKLAGPVAEQWTLYEARRRFFEMKSLPENSVALKGSEEYFQRWASELAERRLFKVPVASSAQKISQLHNGAFRERTLLGLLIQEDYANPRPSDHCERIYLWLWRWISGDSSSYLDKILTSLKNAAAFKSSLHWTALDFEMFRNVVLWLGLFAKEEVSEQRLFLESLKNVQAKALPFFQVEADFLSWAYAHTQGASPEEILHLRARLRHWRERPALAFARLADGKLDIDPASPLKVLLTASQEGLGARALWLVDLEAASIKWGEGGKLLQSQTLALALDLLARSSVVRAEDLLWSCFALSRYDAYHHNRKIQNLLARLRKLFAPHLELRFKEGRIFAQADWSLWTFRGRSFFNQSLKIRQDLREALRLRPSNSASPESSPRKLLCEKWLSRRELESMLGRPRSTVNRLLREWHHKGLLKQKGRSRKTQYLLLPAAREEMQFFERESR
jgi:hypothetical protein